MHIYIYVTPGGPHWCEEGGLLAGGDLGVSRGKLLPRLRKRAVQEKVWELLIV